MNCQDVTQLGVAYLNGEVSVSERKLIQLHVEGCQHCQRELATLSVVQNRISQSLKLRAAQAEASPQAWGHLQAKLAKAPKIHAPRRAYLTEPPAATAHHGLHPAWEIGLGLIALVLLGVVLSWTIRAVSQKNVLPAVETPFNLTHGKFDEVLNPAWAPDGHRLVFSARTRQGQPHHIYLIRDDGSEMAQLTNGTADDTLPRWSPDGANLAFISAEQEKSDLALIKPDGSGRTTLPHLYPGNMVDFAWSPTGAKIAYLSAYGDKNGVFLVNADFSAFIGLGLGIRVQGPLAWSPDGCSLLFSAMTMDGMNWGVHKANTCGKESMVEQVTKDGLEDVNPQWYRDEQSFLYEAGTDIYKFQLDGADYRKLIPDAAGAALSPDGSMVAFRPNQAGSGQLFISTPGLSGDSRRVVSYPGMDDLPPVWSPEGQRLAFLAHSQSDSGIDIFIVRLRDFIPWRPEP